MSIYQNRLNPIIDRDTRRQASTRHIEAPTPASTWQAVAGSPIDDGFLEWPADVFALTDIILGRSEVYRFVVSPTRTMEWPPRRFPDWPQLIDEASRDWCGWLDDRRGALPDLLLEEWRIFCERAQAAFKELAEGRDSRMCDALRTLHAIADESCAGLGVALDRSDGKGCLYRARGRELLARTGSMARIPSHFLRVLPKVRTPPSGSSLRSISR